MRRPTHYECPDCHHDAKEHRTIFGKSACWVLVKGVKGDVPCSCTRVFDRRYTGAIKYSFRDGKLVRTTV